MEGGVAGGCSRLPAPHFCGRVLGCCVGWVALLTGGFSVCVCVWRGAHLRYLLRGAGAGQTLAAVPVSGQFSGRSGCVVVGVRVCVVYLSLSLSLCMCVCACRGGGVPRGVVSSPFAVGWGLAGVGGFSSMWVYC